jgi:hypothetical protein
MRLTARRTGQGGSRCGGRIMIRFLGLAAVASCPIMFAGMWTQRRFRICCYIPICFMLAASSTLATGHNQTYPPPINKMMEMRLEKVTSP